MLASVPILLLAGSGSPRLDLGVHGFLGASRWRQAGEPLDLAQRMGLGVTAWPTERLGLGLRLDAGSYGLRQHDPGNLFALAELSWRLDEAWSAGLGAGTTLLSVQVDCEPGPCAEPEGLDRHPVAALWTTRQLSRGTLRLPLSLRGETAPQRWALGLELGIGLRVASASGIRLDP